MLWYTTIMQNIMFFLFVLLYISIEKSIKMALLGHNHLINPLISRCGNLKMLSKICLIVHYYHAQYNDTFMWKKYQK